MKEKMRVVAEFKLGGTPEDRLKFAITPAQVNEAIKEIAERKLKQDNQARERINALIAEITGEEI